MLQPSTRFNVKTMQQCMMFLHQQQLASVARLIANWLTTQCLKQKPGWMDEYECCCCCSFCCWRWRRWWWPNKQVCVVNNGWLQLLLPYNKLLLLALLTIQKQTQWDQGEKCVCVARRRRKSKEWEEQILDSDTKNNIICNIFLWNQSRVSWRTTWSTLQLCKLSHKWVGEREREREWMSVTPRVSRANNKEFTE